MTIIVVLAGLSGIAWFYMPRDPQIIVSDAMISPMTDGTLMASAKITNGGGPDILIGAKAKGFGHAHFMGGQGDLIVPGGAAPSLAGDGAHVMLSGGEGLQPGQLVPLTLTFRSAGPLTTRARIADAAMDHSNMDGIEAAEINMVLRAEGDPDRGGVSGQIDLSGLTLVAREDGTSHVPGEGHLHIYLNGLKLQRLYETEFQTGQLLPGKYTLSVTANANDHRPYVKDGVPISANLEFTVR